MSQVKAALLFLAGLFIFFACHLTQQEPENVFTLPGLADSLSKYDSARILLKSPTGDTLDVLFHGKIDSNTKLKNLPAPDYHGGTAIISIEGYKDEKVVFRIEKIFDGAKDSVISTQPVILPEASVKLDSEAVKIVLGDSLPFPHAVISPANLKIQDLAWSSDNESVLHVTRTHLKAMQVGSTRAFVRLVSDSTKKDTLAVEVVGIKPPVAVVSIQFYLDSMELVAGGAVVPLKANVLPETANPEVTYVLLQSQYASIDSSGIRGLKAGRTAVVATSKADTTKSDTLPIIVLSGVPERPIVKGSAIPVNTLRPTWTWSSGGNGNGRYRYRVDEEDLTGALETEETSYNPLKNLTEEPHTLVVQERNNSGQWSPSGRFTIRIDTTKPAAPTVSANPTSPTNNTRPTWTWSGGVGDGYRFYRYKLDDNEFGSGTSDTTGTTFRPPAGLSDSVHTLYVQERDSAGNWSNTGSASIIIDTQRPSAPSVSVAPAALTNDDTPTWSWTGQGGGNGTFRWKLANSNLDSGATETSALSYTPTQGLGEGTFTLYVQERDAAGNWSLSGSKKLRIDLTSPTAPKMDSTPYSPLNSLRPKWTWRGGGTGIRVFRCKVDTANLAGAKEQTDSTFTVAVDLNEGWHTLHVQERDSAGNWSNEGYRSILLAPRDTLEKLGFSVGHSSPPQLAISKEGVVYAAYLDYDYFIAHVKKYDFGNKKWVEAGAGLPPEVQSNIEFSMDPNGIPYLICNGYIVKKLVGTVWQNLGDTVINRSRIQSDKHSMAFSKDGTPFLAFQDSSQGYLLSISRYDGTEWKRINETSVGNAVEFFDLDIGADDKPYLAFWDVSKIKTFVVSIDPYYYGSKWDTLGSGPVDAHYLYGLQIKASNKNIYLTTTRLDSAWTYAFLGASWKLIRSEKGGRSGMDVDTNGRLYLAIQSDGNGKQINVLTYINSIWIPIGTPLVVENSEPSLAVSREGVPYVGFRDDSKGGRTSVIRTAFDP